MKNGRMVVRFSEINLYGIGMGVSRRLAQSVRRPTGAAENRPMAIVADSHLRDKKDKKKGYRLR
jgi:hypothetical protein